MSVLSACMMYGMNEWMNENKYWNKLLGNRVLLSFTRIAPYRQMNFTFPFWNCLLNHKQAAERLSLLVKLLERRGRIEITGNYALVWNGKCINHRQSWISKDELKMNENSIVEEWGKGRSRARERRRTRRRRRRKMKYEKNVSGVRPRFEA